MFDDSNNYPVKDKFANLKAIAAGEVSAQPPTPWQHELDKPLIGTIVGFSEFIHDRYGPQKTVIVKQENGEVVSAFLNTYLANGMDMHHAEPGDLVLIKLLGKDKNPRGNEFNKFQLAVEKAI